MIRGVIFDLDGVLVATDEAHYQAWKLQADKEGIPFDRTINERLKGVGRMDSLGIILEQSPRAYSDEHKQMLADRKNASFREQLAKLTPADALPGVRPLLVELRGRGIKLAVASSSRNASLILDRLNLRTAFDAVVDGNDISHSKPHPEVFLLAAERLKLSASECLVVEDAPAGVEAGLRAGMVVFGIGTRDRLPNAKNVASGLDQVTMEALLKVIDA